MPNSKDTPRAERLKGYVVPLDPTGHASLYGPTPWVFAGRSFMVFARASRSFVAAFLPQPLEPTEEPLVRFTTHDLICDLGFGWRHAQENPGPCQFREASVAMAVQHDGVVGYWGPFLWCDSDAELAVGREMFGWPQVLGDIDMTQPHPARGWAPGDRVAGHVGRHGRAVFEIAMSIEHDGPIPADLPAFTHFYTMRVLPDPTDGSTTRELFVSIMDDVQTGDLWSGEAEIRTTAPELAALELESIVGGHCHTVSWVKNRAKLISRTDEPAP